MSTLTYYKRRTGIEARYYRAITASYLRVAYYHITASWWWMLFITYLLVTFVHLDILPDIATYGVSFGTDGKYCSVELVHYIPKASCENAS